MAKLYVIPHDVVEMLNGENIPLSVLKDTDAMIDALSVNDMADIHFATVEFPFRFDSALDIELALSPYEQLQTETQIHTTTIERLNNRIQDAVLEETRLTDIGISTRDVRDYDAALRRLGMQAPKYSLVVVDENVWVAVLQRQNTHTGDPGQTVLSSNHSFFDDMIAQVLHTRSFVEVSCSNLFTFYLGSITPETLG